MAGAEIGIHGMSMNKHPKREKEDKEIKGRRLARAEGVLLCVIKSEALPHALQRMRT